MLGYRRDGGSESHVDGWFIEVKSLFTVCLLRFGPGSREAYHSHAFHAVSWLLRGCLVERFVWGGFAVHTPGVALILTTRDNMHKVSSVGTSWVLSFRGPWAPYWYELVNGALVKLGFGRRVCA